MVMVVALLIKESYNCTVPTFFPKSGQGKIQMTGICQSKLPLIV